MSKTNKLPKDVLREIQVKAAPEVGKNPSDVTVKVERKKGRPTGGLFKESAAAGGKKSRLKTKSYQPTDDDYCKVEEMVTIGLDQHTIAKVMGVSIATLVKYYRHNLDVAKEKRTAKVAGVAYEMAVSGESPSMTTFWLKTQAGWSPKHHVVVEDKNLDIQWANDEADIADANRLLREKDESVH